MEREYEISAPTNLHLLQLLSSGRVPAAAKEKKVPLLHDEVLRAKLEFDQTRLSV